MRSPNQKMRFNDEEMSLLKGLFENNEEALFLIRRAMLQDKLTEIDKANLKEVVNETVWKLMQKVFNARVEYDAPIGQITHLGLAVGAEIKSLSPDGAWPFIKSKELVMKYLDQQLEVLRGNESNDIVLMDLIDLSGSKPNREQKYINVLTWNWLMSWIDSCVATIDTLAKKPVETAEERVARIEKDSSK